ncbi:MAG: type II toxin-antitoxin system RelE/ParE family toxin [Phycisphaerales bacterium]|nr:type II toxin-antitoxin system RelE/ParE family toxin [Phycisphaerales bacterium]
MGRYAVSFKPSAERTLRRLPKGVQRRIVSAVDSLADDPRPSGVVKLRGDTNLWRIRVGDYRAVYEIHGDRLVVLILRVAHRKDVYRRT